MNDYSDIIHLPHHVSIKHTPMALYKRAAQFAPFAALRGYDDEIAESDRVVDSKPQLDEERIEQLNQKLMELYERQVEKPLVEILYFQSDARKEGGICLHYTGNLRFYEPTESALKFVDGTVVAVADLLQITILNENEKL